MSPVFFVATATEEKDWKIDESCCKCEVRVYLARVHGKCHSCSLPSTAVNCISAKVSIPKFSTRRNEEKLRKFEEEDSKSI
jgi:hypothetical protein